MFHWLELWQLDNWEKLRRFSVHSDTFYTRKHWKDCATVEFWKVAFEFFLALNVVYNQDKQTLSIDLYFGYSLFELYSNTTELFLIVCFYLSLSP